VINRTDSAVCCGCRMRFPMKHMWAAVALDTLSSYLYCSNCQATRDARKAYLEAHVRIGGE